MPTRELFMSLESSTVMISDVGEIVEEADEYAEKTVVLLEEGVGVLSLDCLFLNSVVGEGGYGSRSHSSRSSSRLFTSYRCRASVEVNIH
jgi:hypothetical protein